MRAADAGECSSEAAATTVTVSVVIPAFNEEHHLPRCLDALRRQTLGRDRFEVILVDNGSTDATVAVAEAAAALSAGPPLRVVSRERCSISAVRNYGAELAQGRVLAFLDADCIPPPGWLEAALAMQPVAGIWGAHYRVPANATWVGRVWAQYQAVEQEGPATFVPGGDLLVSQEDFATIGGFDEQVRTSEDVEICARATKLGMGVVAYRELAVWHEGTPRTLRGFYRQNRWHGEHVLRVFLTNLPATRNWQVVALSAYTLGMFWAAVLVPLVSGVLGWRPAALIPVALLLAPAVVLALRKVSQARDWHHLPSLTCLYTTYLLARAASMTHLSRRSHR